MALFDRPFTVALVFVVRRWRCERRQRATFSKGLLLLLSLLLLRYGMQKQLVPELLHRLEPYVEFKIAQK